MLFEEKISQLRIYSGAKYDTAETVLPGQICAALGLTGTYPGQGLGAAGDFAEPLLEPVMTTASFSRRRATRRCCCRS